MICRAYPLNGCSHPQFCEDQCKGHPTVIDRETMDALFAKVERDNRWLREQTRADPGLLNEPMTI